MIKRIGKRTLALENRPYLLGHAAAVGKKEGEGPLGERFDYVAKNDRMGQRSWELAESEFQKTAIRLALRKAALPEHSLDLIIDDLGAEPRMAIHYGQRFFPLQEMLMRRYVAFPQAKTYITTNLTMDEIGHEYGERVRSRLEEMCDVIVMRGGDRRKK